MTNRNFNKDNGVNYTFGLKLKSFSAFSETETTQNQMRDKNSKGRWREKIVYGKTRYILGALYLY